MAAKQSLGLAPRVLLGPGPSDVHPRVLAAMAAPLVGHLDPQFLEIMNDVQDLLRFAFRTRNRLTFPVSGTGSAGMEACLVNLLETGDRALVCVNGAFGQRMAEVGARTGAEVTTLTRPWGQVFQPDEVAEALGRVRPKVLAIVHGETSTGACQRLEDLGPLCRRHDALLLVDAVTSLGGVPVEVDAWGIDAVYSGTQKCLSCPPGLSPVSFGPRALDAISRRRTKVQSWYLDVTLVQRYWAEERFYHHTAPVSMVYALREALRLIAEEGLEARWRRHALNYRALRAGLAGLGIPYVAAEVDQLPTLNAIRIPAGADDSSSRDRLLAEFGIEIGGGLGELKGRIWRVGLMGHGSRPNNVLLFLAALEQCLIGQGVRVEPGAGVAAANRVYQQEAE